MSTLQSPKAPVIAGRYSLDREIGRGGSGIVWLGRDERLGRPVALKRIGVLDADEQTHVARAEREARLAAQLHHPHVVSVFDAVTDDRTGDRWLVMEYVDGPSLARLVRDRGPLSPAEAAPLLRQAAAGLAAAHAAGIAHRDVKPSNVLVGRDGQVKITDFGIARLAGDATITQTGFVTGSPAYLAPEVASGGRGDETSDVWALGATAYHLLAARSPYEIGDNVVGGLYKIVHDEPPRLAGAGWLAPLLEATMVKDPAQRWTMAQVSDYLAAAGEVALPATAVPAVPAAEREPRPEETQVVTPAAGGRRRWLVPVLVAVLLLLIAGLSWTFLRDLDSAPRTPAASRSPQPSPAPAAKAKTPTAAGMTAFIKSYVDAVSADPSRSWEMLTPKFQRDSGGFKKYGAFWRSATNGRVSDVNADPRSLTVSYQVRFDNHDNGPGPTVLQLSFDEQDGSYRIDGETSRGFTPAP